MWSTWLAGTEIFTPLRSHSSHQGVIDSLSLRNRSQAAEFKNLLDSCAEGDV